MREIFIIVTFKGVSQVRKTASPDREARPSGWEWAETTIWTDRMLTALVNGVKGGKWFSLTDKVFSPNTLSIAWRKVAANQGAAGVDGISIQRFEDKSDAYLKELSEALESGAYSPMAVRRAYIPKGGGKRRPLGIPTVKDRTVQMALKLVLEPIFEKEFLSCSYGFRPGVGAKDALRDVDGLLEAGNNWVVDADLKSFFDSIPHEFIMEELGKRVSDRKVLDLVGRFLRQDILDGMESWTPAKGTPQGAVLSPLLSNMVLHTLDCHMTRRGFHFVRYADDFVTLCPNRFEAEKAFAVIREWVADKRLKLHPDKTHVGNSSEPGQGFEFLGYRFESGQRRVRRQSFKRLKDAIRKKTKRTIGRGLKRIIEDLNPTLKGWFQYFKHARHFIFRIIDGFVRRRLRAILRKQNKRPGMGLCRKDHQTWPNKFFAALGLFTMREAWELASQSRCGNQ